MHKKLQWIRKWSALFLIVCVLAAASGCSVFSHKTGKNPTQEQPLDSQNDQSDNESFAKYLDELFKETVSSDMLTLHSYVQNPEKYGITDYKVEFEKYALENLDDTKDITDSLNKLKAFNRSTLSAKQQLTYDQLLQYLQTRLEYSDLYLFDTCLSTTIGYQVQLPIILAEYQFYSEKDVQEYLVLLADTDAFFQNIVDYETLRSRNGFFMEDSLADDIIKQCQTFVDSADNCFLIGTFDEKLDALSNISAENKAMYKAQNQTAVSEHVIHAYKILIEGLTRLKGSGKYSGGLCNYPNGKKYYEYLIQKDMGWSKSVEEYNKLLDSYISKNMLAMQALMLKNPSLVDEAEQYAFALTEPKEILEDLKKHISQDFPAGPSVNCSIKYITKALQDYASPAMYFTPQLDNFFNNSIYINPGMADHSQLYTTMAHEGYPGHLYQITYFANTNPDKIRFLIDPGGFVEGWATYCEIMSYSYCDAQNEDLNQLMMSNNVVILCLYAKVDIGVNYFGWTVDDIVKFMSTYGFGDRGICENMYAVMVSQPANYCKYVLGYIGFCELKDAARTKLGDRFNQKDFHKFILDIGPVPFDILFQRLNTWAAAKTAQQS